MLPKELASCCVALLVLSILRPMSLSLDLIDLELILKLIDLEVSSLVLAGSVLVDLGPVSFFIIHPAAIRVLMQPLWRPRGRRATLKVAHLLVGPPIYIKRVGVGWGLVGAAWRLIGAGYL